MEEKKVITLLGIELGKRDRASLIDFISGMRFSDAFKLLGGYNLENDILFDCNFKSITATIFKESDGYCRVGNHISVWLSDISSPVLECVIE